MTVVVAYFNGGMTLAENALNVLSYIPNPKLKAWVVKSRLEFGCVQIVIGVALCIFGFLASCLTKNFQSQTYLTRAQQSTFLGTLYINHGVLNIIRSFIERQGWVALTAAYDFYGRKFMPPISTSFDLQGQLFARIRAQLDRIHFITLIPLKFHLRDC